jgi:type VI secretion system protein ImpG
MRLDEEMLQYYFEELNDLHKAGRDFAHRHPKIASRLELHDGYPADPHVERLIESFAFLTARLRREMDAEFPELTTSLLGILYPHLVQPVPPMAVARFAVDAKRVTSTNGHQVARHTPLFSYGSGAVTCRFRTCYPVHLWPVEVREATLEPAAKYDFLSAHPGVTSVLRLRISTLAKSLAELEWKTLRFFLDPRAGSAYRVYELLFSALERTVLLPQDTQAPVALPAGAVTPVGFDSDEDLLPYPPNSHPGYRLLQEYFHFPEKFLFFDLHDLSAHSSQSHFDVLFLLSQTPRDRLSIDRHLFVLGCTPVVNLFPRTTEPIRLDQRRLEYRLVPDIRREHTTEIHSILAVSGSSNPAEETRHYEPFYSYRHTSERGAPREAYWHARRVSTGREDMPGTEIYLSFLDLNLDPGHAPDQTVFAHTLCTNRWLATELPPGAKLQMEEAGPAAVTCLGKPTPPAYPPLGGPSAWQLISNLSLNHLSLSSSAESLAALREILRIYCFSDRPAVLHQIQGIRGIACRTVPFRIGFEAWRGFCTGTEVTLTFDESQFAGSSALLFSSVLRHFLALYGSVNSFTQVVARRVNREEEWKRWPPLAGEERLL